MRKWKIFAMDISKQSFGSAEIHIINILFSLFESSMEHSDQCAWYVTSIFIDVTLGVLINFILIKITDLSLK